MRGIITSLGRHALRSRRPQLFQFTCDLDCTRRLNTNVSPTETEAMLPLAGLKRARFRVGLSNQVAEPIDLSIYRPECGGHVMLGRNAIGKSRILQALQDRGETLVECDSFITHEPPDHSPNQSSIWHKHAIQSVSFESHQELLKQAAQVEAKRQETGSGPPFLTASKAISDGGNLNKAAQFLIVRFGLYHLLHRNVTTLSTGEIRKVLLVRALAARPVLLLLDNAFDGLDVASRQQLTEIVSKTLQGFSADALLVQAVSAKATGQTQVLQVTHRPEEVVDEMQWIHSIQKGQLIMRRRTEEETGLQVWQNALQQSDAPEKSGPTQEAIANWWNQPERTAGSGPVVRTEQLTVLTPNQKEDAQDEYIALLQDLTWTVNQGERWVVAGRNGAGKSTLTRLLVSRSGDRMVHGMLKVLDQEMTTDSSLPDVGWVSTELHMRMAQSEQTVGEVVEDATVAAWFDLLDLLDRPMRTLSQGQQKWVLIAAAVASRHPLLILDEATQGLDDVRRQLLLKFLDDLCQATDLSVLYITHHWNEVVPSMSHVLHLEGGRALYQGTRELYDPEAYASPE